MAKPPNTISDEQYYDLQKRAIKAAPSMFSKEAREHAKQSEAQRRKADQS